MFLFLTWIFLSWPDLSRFDHSRPAPSWPDLTQSDYTLLKSFRHPGDTPWIPFKYPFNLIYPPSRHPPDIILTPSTHSLKFGPYLTSNDRNISNLKLFPGLVGGWLQVHNHATSWLNLLLRLKWSLVPGWDECDNSEHVLSMRFCGIFDWGAIENVKLIFCHLHLAYMIKSFSTSAFN